MLTNSLRTAIAAALILASGAACAEMHTYEVTATVTDSLDPTTPVGTKLHASFAYDDAKKPSSSFGDSVNYDFDTYLVANYGDHRVEGDVLRTSVINDGVGGAFDMVAIEASYPITLDGELMSDGVFQIVLSSRPNDTHVLPNSSMPVRYDMADWDPIRSYGVLQRNGSQTGGIINFKIDSIETYCVKQNGQDAKKNCWYR